MSRKSKSTAAAARRRIGPFEPLEVRNVLANIVWVEELNFDFLGENEALARQLVERAIDDWSKVIVDFNYDGDNNPDTDNTLVVNIGIFPFLGSTRGVAAVPEVDANGLPRKAEIFLDAEGGDQGWFFDATPLDDGEFAGGLVDPFRAVINNQPTNDFYRTILHELGHGMGIKAGTDLAFDRFLTPAGTDQVEPSDELKVFHNPNGPFGSQGFSGTITTSGGVHTYEGPADPAFPNIPLHLGDLMNTGRTIKPPPTARQLISDLNVMMLVDAYGYNAILPSQLNTFHVVLDSVSGELFVQGDVGNRADTISIKRDGTDLEVRVNQTLERVPLGDVTNIVVEGGGGNDVLTIDYSGGNPIPAGGISYDGGGQTGALGDSLVVSGGSAETVTHFLTSSTSGSVDVDGAIVSYTDLEPVTDTLSVRDRRFVFGDAADDIAIGDDTVAANNVSRISSSFSSDIVNFRHPIGSLVVLAGAGDDTISIEPLDSGSSVPLTVDRGPGISTISLRGGTLHETALGTGQVTLTGGETLIGGGAVTGAITVGDASELVVSGNLSARDIANDGTIILNPASQLDVRNLENGGGILDAAADSTVRATGVVTTGGLGADKQFGNLSFSGPEATLSGPVDALGTVALTDSANIVLQGTVNAGGLTTEPGTLLVGGAVNFTLAGDLLLADSSYTGSGFFEITADGDLAGNNNLLQQLIIAHDDQTTLTGPLVVDDGGLALASGTFSLEGNAEFRGPVTINDGGIFVNPASATSRQFVFQDQVEVQSGAELKVLGPGSRVSFSPGTRLAARDGSQVSFIGNATASVSLRSQNTGQVWFLDAEEDSDVDVVNADVRDSNASGSADFVVAASSTDSGNNTNWLFVDAALAVHLDENGVLLIIDVLEKSDSLTIGTQGASLVIEDPNNTVETNVGTQVNPNRVTVPVNLITANEVFVDLDEGADVLTIEPAPGGNISVPLVIMDSGRADNDTLVVDLSQGGTFSDIQFDAGGGANDTLQIIGDTDAQSVLEFTPGVVVFNGAPVAFTGTANAFLSNVQRGTYVAPVATNEINVSRPTGDLIVVGGTVDGTAFTQFTFDDISKITELIIQGDEGADGLTVDHTSGLDPIPGRGISFHAGNQPDGQEDKLEIRGGSFQRIVYDYDNTMDGLIDLSGRFVRFTGVEPIINSGSSTNLFFDLTSLPDVSRLEDAGNGQLSLTSINQTFQSTTFNVPSLRIAVFNNQGDDSLTVGDLGPSGFTGELRLFGHAGNDTIEVAATSGIDYIVTGDAGANILLGLGEGSLRFDGGSQIQLSNLTINDVSDGSPAVVIADPSTRVQLDGIVVNGRDDDLIRVVDGAGAPGQPAIVSSSLNNTFRFESGAGGVSYVDNQTSPAANVNVNSERLEMVVGPDQSRRIKLASDDRTIASLEVNGATHGNAVNHGDGTVTYTPDAGFIGQARFNYRLNDSSTGTVNIEVLPANQAPVNAVPGAQTIDEDSTLVFSNANGNSISISDPDAGNDVVMVEVFATSGTLTAKRAGQTRITGDGTNTLTLAGRVSNINATLNGLTYSPNPNFAGTDTLTVRANDRGNNGSGGPLSDTDTVRVTVRAFNDAPLISQPEGQTINEDTALVFSSANGNVVSIADPDAGTGGVEIRLSANNGVLRLATTAGLTNVTGDGSTAISARGTVSNINAALNGLSFTPASEFFGDVTLTIDTNDFGNSGTGGPLMDSQNVSISVVSFNDTPVNSVPNSQSIDEDAALVFSSANGNRITISDVDAGGQDVEVSVSVNNGFLSLPTTQGLTSVSGDGMGVLTITGLVSNINSALNGLAYKPVAHFDGTEVLTVRTNDLGNTGAGGVMVDSDTVNIDLRPINDRPVNVVPGGQSINEDDQLVFSTSTGGPITVEDVDSGEGGVRVTLRVDNGALVVSDVDDLQSVSGNGTGTVVLDGNTTAVNSALEGMVYQPNADFNGLDVLAITTSDLGNTGSGGVQTDSDRVNITIRPRNDGPRVALSIDPVEVLQDSGPQSLAGFVTATVGPPDEIAAGQRITNLAITANDNPALFTSQPIIGANGTLMFTSAPDTFGSAVVTINATDDGGRANGGADTTVTDFQINILSDNKIPTVASPLSDVDVTEDANNTFINLGVNGSNVFNDADNEQLTISATSADPGLVSASIVGNQLVLDFQADRNGKTTVDVTATDAEGASAIDTFAVNVDAINDAPVNQLPSQQSSGGEPVVFSNTTGNAISIRDVDAGITAVQVMLTVSSGTLTLGDAEGVIAIGDGSSSVTIDGPISLINQALDGLFFTPTSGFSGAVTLNVTTNDRGNSGAGGPLTDADSLAILVNTLNRPPAITSTDTASIPENSTDVLVVTANDPDGDPVSFSIGGGVDQAFFDINSVSGALRFRNAPDFENPADADGNNVYVVFVRADDGNGGISAQPVQVRVTDVAEAGPTVTIRSVTPDPRAGSINSVGIVFSQAVTGFGVDDLSLTRSTNNTVNVALASATLTTTDSVTWTLGSLSGVTGNSGIYELSLLAAGSGIQDLSGAPLTGGATERWTNGAGDTNEDRQFNQADLVRVLQANLYLTGLPAIWSTGDWNRDGLFNQRDIIVAQQTQPPHYLQGPFAALAESVPARPPTRPSVIIDDTISDRLTPPFNGVIAAVDAVFERLGR